MSGFIAAPKDSRRDTKGLWVFVNGRYVRERVLQRAIMDAYIPVLERGRYPQVVIYVDINPEAIDVNVHPQKREVRFSNSAAVFRALSGALSAAISQPPWDQESPTRVGEFDAAEASRESTAAAVDSFYQRSRSDSQPWSAQGNVWAHGGGDSSHASTAEPGPLSEPSIPIAGGRLSYLGSVDGFVLLQWPPFDWVVVNVQSAARSLATQRLGRRGESAGS